MPLIKTSEYDELKNAKKELEELKKDLDDIDVDNLPTAEELKEKDDEIQKLQDEIKALKAGKVLHPAATQLTPEQYKAKTEKIVNKFKNK